MNVALRRAWTQAEFFEWVQTQEERYEFDGGQPVAMNGGTLNHNVLHQNIAASLRALLRGGPCRPFGPDVGVATVGDTIRYPDAVVSCTKFDGAARAVPQPVVVFEVISPGSSRIDRIVKVREYAAAPSIQVYVIVESEVVGFTVFSRASGSDIWTASTLSETDVLDLPLLGISFPVIEAYEGVDLGTAPE